MRAGIAIRRLEKSPCQPSSKWIPFGNQVRKRQRKEKDGLHPFSAVSNRQWTSNPNEIFTCLLNEQRWFFFTFLAPVLCPTQSIFSACWVTNALLLFFSIIIVIIFLEEIQG